MVCEQLMIEIDLIYELEVFLHVYKLKLCLNYSLGRFISLNDHFKENRFSLK